MGMSLPTLIFLGIPEMIALTFLCTILAKASLDWKQIILAGSVFACITYLIRQFPVTFGLHTIVLIVLMILMIYKMGKTSVVRAILATFISFIVLIITETVTSLAFFSLLDVTPEIVSKNNMLMIISGWPSVILIFLVAFICRKYLKKEES